MSVEAALDRLEVTFLMNKLFGQRSGDSFGAADSPSRSPIKNTGYGSPSAYPDEMLDDLDGSPYGTTMKLPVKNHIGRLEDLLDNLRNELEESKKEAQLIRADMMAMEHTLKESNNDVARQMMDECLRAEKDFRKIMNVEKAENEFIKQQLRQLNQDKMKLQQNCLVLENRVEGSEGDVGFKGLVEYRHDPEEQ